MGVGLQIPDWDDDGGAGPVPSDPPITITGALTDYANQPPAPGGSLGLLMDPRDIADTGVPPGTASADGAAPSGVMTITQVDPAQLVLGRPDGTYLPAGPQNPIGPAKGYPETGKDAWRAGNDDAITAAVAKYNSDNQYFPGDSQYMTPQLMKSWMMQESGGSKQAFQTDPFQVNTGNWAPEKEKIAGLTQDQVMTPQTSADAALKWLQYKGSWPAVGSPSVAARQANYGPYEALENYNGSSTPVNGVPRKIGYANSILNRAWDSYGDWLQ